MRCLVLRLLALPLLVATAPGPASGFDLLVVSGGSDQVLRFDGATGGFLSVFDDVTDPRGIATDGAGLVYVSNLGGLITQYQEDGTLLDFLFTGLGPIGRITVGPDGLVYAPLFFEDRVVRISFAVDPPAVLGDFVSAGSGGLDGPSDLTFGPGGDLYVASNDAQAVLRFDGDTGAALGVFADPIGTSTDGMKPVFGPDGRLYVNLTTSGQIERFDGATGAAQGVFVATGSGGLAEPWDFVTVPEPGAAVSGLLAALALAAVRLRRA